MSSLSAEMTTAEMADPPKPGRRPRRWFGFVGAGCLVAVGYTDPGNWATAIAGGARYGYTLLYSDNKQLIAPVHHYMHQNLQLTGGRVAQLGPTIGTHVGPGVVGVVFVAKE